jgi:hypothetical protein
MENLELNDPMEQFHQTHPDHGDNKTHGEDMMNHKMHVLQKQHPGDLHLHGDHHLLLEEVNPEDGDNHLMDLHQAVAVVDLLMFANKSLNPIQDGVEEKQDGEIHQFQLDILEDGD